MPRQGDPTLLEWEAQGAGVSASSQSNLDKLLCSFRRPEDLTQREKASASSASRVEGGAASFNQENFRATLVKTNSAAESLASRCRELLPRLHARGPAAAPIPSVENGEEGVYSERSRMLLEIEKDAQGPFIELEVGVGVFDVHGEALPPSRLKELGVEEVYLPEDSPTFRGGTPAPVDAVQHFLSQQKGSLLPTVSVLSSCSSDSSSDAEEAE